MGSGPLGLGNFGLPVTEVSSSVKLSALATLALVACESGHAHTELSKTRVESNQIK